MNVGDIDVQSYIGGAPAKLTNFPSGWEISVRKASAMSSAGS